MFNVDGHPTIPDFVAVQSLQNNASVKSFHDGDIERQCTERQNLCSNLEELEPQMFVPSFS